MQGIFETKINYYSTRDAPAFSSRIIKTIKYGLQTISYMAAKILVLRDETSYYSEWIQGQNKYLEIRKLSLLAL